MNRKRLLTLIETAILTAMSFVLGMIEPINFPQGGGISLVMVPLVILSIRRGIIAGLIGGLLVGLLKLIGGQIYYPTQAILDYPLAFALVGLAGLFVIKNKKSPFKLYLLGIGLAGLLKGLSHTLSGAIFFAAYAPEGWNPWIYSIVYNSSFVIPETILAMIVVAVFYYKADHLFVPKSN